MKIRAKLVLLTILHLAFVHTLDEKQLLTHRLKIDLKAGRLTFLRSPNEGSSIIETIDLKTKIIDAQVISEGKELLIILDKSKSLLKIPLMKEDGSDYFKKTSLRKSFAEENYKLNTLHAPLCMGELNGEVLVVTQEKTIEKFDPFQKELIEIGTLPTYNEFYGCEIKKFQSQKELQISTHSQDSSSNYKFKLINDPKTGAITYLSFIEPKAKKLLSNHKQHRVSSTPISQQMGPERSTEDPKIGQTIGIILGVIIGIGILIIMIVVFAKTGCCIVCCDIMACLEMFRGCCEISLCCFEIFK